MIMRMFFFMVILVKVLLFTEGHIANVTYKVQDASIFINVRNISHHERLVLLDKYNHSLASVGLIKNMTMLSMKFGSIADVRRIKSIKILRKQIERSENQSKLSLGKITILLLTWSIFSTLIIIILISVLIRKKITRLTGDCIKERFVDSKETVTAKDSSPTLTEQNNKIKNPECDTIPAATSSTNMEYIRSNQEVNGLPPLIIENNIQETAEEDHFYDIPKFTNLIEQNEEYYKAPKSLLKTCKVSSETFQTETDECKERTNSDVAYANIGQKLQAYCKRNGLSKNRLSKRFQKKASSRKLVITEEGKF